MCDWDWMVQRIADMHPLFEPGTKAAYMSYTFGWVIGEVVRRTVPRSRQFGTFIQEEICQPLDLSSLWVGIPDAVEARVATLTQYAADPSRRALDGPWSAQSPGDSAAGGDDPGGVWTG